VNVKRVVVSLNGISIAYMMGVVNAALAMLLAFGITLTFPQQASIVTFVNAALVLLAHLSHRLGEAENNLKASPAVPPTPPTPDAS
jgi:phosphotransferase system  glucose/maltose/N-acetylglucosamine-specific IIC component